MKALMMGVITKEIKEKKLLENVTITGNWLKQQLIDIGKRYPQLANVRGEGTMLAFDLPSAEARDSLVRRLRQLGVQSSGCGVATIRLRPMLVFKPKHAQIFVELLEKALKQDK